MSIDLEIPGSLLNSLVSDSLQQKFNTTCVPSFQDDDGQTTYIDSVTVQSVTNVVSTNVIDFPVDAQLLLLSQSELDASVGGLTPDLDVLTAQIALQMVPQGATLSFVVQSINLSPPDSTLQNLINSFVASSLSGFGTIDLGTLFQTLGLPLPTNTEFVSSGGSVLIRFNPGPPPSDHLINGLQWSIFIPSSALEGSLFNLTGRSVVPELLKSGFTLGNQNATYTGSQTGNANLEATINATKSANCTVESFTVFAALDFKVQIYLRSQTLGNPQLAELIYFNLNLSSNVGFDPFNLVQHELNGAAIEAMASFDPSTIGATRLGQPGSDYSLHNFEILSDLPDLSFGNARLLYNNNLVAQDIGIVLGGNISYQPLPPLFDLTYTVTKFNPFDYTQWTYCGETPSEPFVQGIGTLTNTVQLCSTTIVSPTSAAAQSVVMLSTTPSPGETANQVIVTAYMTAASASIFLSLSDGQNLVVQVETTRGVRLLDFGFPPSPQLDSNGNLLIFIQVPVGVCHPDIVTLGIPQIPLSLPAHGVVPAVPSDWVGNLGGVMAFESTILEVGEVGLGDVLLVRQPVDGGVTVVSAKEMTVQIPVLVALRGFDEGAVLERADRGLIRSAKIRAKTFVKCAVLYKRGAQRHRLVATKSFAQVVTTFENRVEITDVFKTGLVFVRQIIKGKEGERKLPRAVLESQATIEPKIELPGLEETRTVPGFEDGNIVIGRFDDGSFRLISKDSGGKVVVYGTVPRWLNMPATSGNWAISSRRGDWIEVFRIVDKSPKRCSCGCHSEEAARKGE